MVDTYTTLTGAVIDLGNLTPEQRQFFVRCLEAYRQEISWPDFINLVRGRENPLLRETGAITKEVTEHPLYKVLSDLEERLGVRQGWTRPQGGADVHRDPTEDRWVSVAEAARMKGVSVPAIHNAVRRGDLVARPAGAGSRFLVISVRSLEAYRPRRVRRGRKDSEAAGDAPAEVEAREGE
ncbi:helix-turn-helix domain-containing protein [Caldinitratiruptor microaerophilus]|uniref:Helix-turn-helix domain-containing protein n=1 Tax=Caldinitratiruptor microaerophilus TaxID=671077 RepID=A0AA35CKG5_9FIRM|nr:helix-turn-helix domain-containing protein [Caldinitratiruptor microaerophilus]BDG60945.1 hypothetical protein caldi_20350 [Caldinitratiruptor microaerophilus]